MKASRAIQRNKYNEYKRQVPKIFRSVYTFSVWLKTV